MAENSGIEWTDATWTPIRAINKATGKVGWHCEHASDGCRFCYSEVQINKRFGTGLPFKPGHRKDVDIYLDEKMLTAPLKWRGSKMVFVCSMTDLFADFVKTEWIDRMFAVMRASPQHTYQVLTKRAKRMAEYASALPTPLPNVWMGVSVEHQDAANERIPHLLATPAAVRFVSAEPLLEAINFTRIKQGNDWVNALSPVIGLRTDNGKDHIQFARHPSACIGWAIVGGESGSGARPFPVSAGRDIIKQCKDAGVPVFMKQMGAKPVFGTIPAKFKSSKGGEMSEWPLDMQVREMPKPAVLEAA